MAADLVEWLTSVWDEEEAAFDVACEAEAERCRNDGIPDETAEEVKAYWQTLPDWAGWKFPLARIAADRKILELHTGDHNCREIVTGTYPADWPEGVSWGKPGASWRHATDEYYDEGEYCPTARLLAAAHADRPGFRDEWRV